MQTPAIRPVRASVAAILVAGLAALVPAFGGPRSEADPAQSPESRAFVLHERGIADRDRAMQLELGLSRTEIETDRGRLEKEIDQAYRAAAKEFRAAASSDPQMFEAFADLGDVLNRTGDARGALKALDQALALEPDDPAALFHRGEAYLALDRVEDAKSSFSDVFAADPKRAELLLLSMKQWVIGKRQDMGRTSPETMASLEDWIEDLEAAAAQELAEVE